MDPSQILAQILGAAGITAAQVPSDIDVSPGNILLSIVILLFVYFLARFSRGLLRRAFKQTNFDERVEQLVIQVVYYGIIGLGIVWILGGFGLSVVLLSIAAGFAFKDLIQNFAAGLLIMGTRPFHQGDWITVGNSEGRVAEVGWRGTFIDTFDGRRVIVPNSSIINSVVINNSLHPRLRSSISLVVSAKADFARVERLVLAALEPIAGICKQPPPAVLIDSLPGAVMNLAVSLWIEEPADRQKQVMSDALRAVKETLSANDIDMTPAPVAPAPAAPAPRDVPPK